MIFNIRLRLDKGKILPHFTWRQEYYEQSDQVFPYSTVILKHTKNISVFMKYKSNQQLNVNVLLKIYLAGKDQDMRNNRSDCSPNVIISKTLRFLKSFSIFSYEFD